MLTRRALLEGALRGSSLVTMGSLVPGFLATTARAAGPGGDTVLVVLEMTGGNDGLNTVVPYADDHYHRARPKLRLTKDQVVRVDDRVGLNPGLRGLEKFLSAGQLAIVQGVGYPNPDRSHFESMDVWQMADPSRKAGTGWLARSVDQIQAAPGKVPCIHADGQALPMALRGAAAGIPTVHPGRPFDLELAARGPMPGNNGAPFAQVDIATPERTGGGEDGHSASRRRLIEGFAGRGRDAEADAANPMLQFVRRSSLQAYSTIENLREVSGGNARNQAGRFRGGARESGPLAQNLALVGQMIKAEFGTRLFYLSVSGFDTHSGQLATHQQLLAQVAEAISSFFAMLEQSGHARRVILMTFSEFGRRVQENGSQGTDHGAASCQFLVGPGVAGGVVGAHPDLDPAKLDAGDLRHHTDFRRVYATLLDGWLGCDSAAVLGSRFEPLPLLKTS